MTSIFPKIDCNEIVRLLATDLNLEKNVDAYVIDLKQKSDTIILVGVREDVNTNIDKIYFSEIQSTSVITNKQLKVSIKN